MPARGGNDGGGRRRRTLFIDMKRRSACSIFSEWPPGWTRWSSARRKSSDRPRKHTPPRANPEPSDPCCIVFSSAPSGWQSRCAPDRNHPRRCLDRLGRSRPARSRFSVTSRRARCCCSAPAKRANGRRALSPSAECATFGWRTAHRARRCSCDVGGRSGGGDRGMGKPLPRGGHPHFIYRSPNADGDL